MLDIVSLKKYEILYGKSPIEIILIAQILYIYRERIFLLDVGVKELDKINFPLRGLHNAPIINFITIEAARAASYIEINNVSDNTCYR